MKRFFESGYNYIQDVVLKPGTYVFWAYIKSEFGDTFTFALANEANEWEVFDVDVEMGQWSKVYEVFTITEKKVKLDLINRYFDSEQPVFVFKPQLIKGNIPTDAGASPFDIDSIVDDLHDNIQGIADFTNEEFADRVLSASERISLKRDMEAVETIFQSLKGSYEKLIINPFVPEAVITDLTAKYNAVTSSKTNLFNVLNLIIAGDNIVTPEEITAKDDALLALNAALYNYNLAEKEIQNALGADYTQKISAIRDFTDNEFADRYLSKTEKISLSHDLDSVQTLVDSVTSRFNEMLLNPFLTGADRDLLIEKYNALLDAWDWDEDLDPLKPNGLKTIILNIINDPDDLIDPAEMLEKDAALSAFNIALGEFSETEVYVSKITIDYAIEQATFWSINATSPVIYKDAKDAVTDGHHMPVTVKGQLHRGTQLQDGGYLTVTADADVEAVEASPSPVLIEPLDYDDKSLYTVKLYDSAAKTILLDTMTIPVVFRGANGKDAINITLSNEIDSVPASNEGVVSSYDNTGTDIRVFEGVTELTYDGVGTSPGTFKVTSLGIDLSVGTISSPTVGILKCVIGNISNLLADKGITQFTITGKTLGNESFSEVKEQRVTKGKMGDPGEDGEDGITISQNQQGYTYRADLNGNIIGSLANGMVELTITSGSTPITCPSSLSGGTPTTNGTYRVTRTLGNGITTNSSLSGGKYRITPATLTVDEASVELEIKIMMGGVVTSYPLTLTYRKQFDGADGKSTEFIFKGSTSDTTAPTLPSTSQQDDWHGQGTTNEWNDDLVEPTKTLPYVWASQRKKVDGVWGAFTTPKVWLRYVEDGDPGDPGEDGYSVSLSKSEHTFNYDKNGNLKGLLSDGVVSVEVVKGSNAFMCDSLGTLSPTYNNTYRVTSITQSPTSSFTYDVDRTGSVFRLIPVDMTVDEVEITLTIVARSNDNNTTFTRKIRYQKHKDGADGIGEEFIFKANNSDAVPPVLPQTADTNYQDDDYYGQGTANEWNDDPVAPTKLNQFVWAAKRKKIGGVWEAFGTPSVWTKWVEDGSDAKSLILSASSLTMACYSTNVAKPGQTITINAKLQNVSGTATFVATPYNDAGTALTAVTLGGTGNIRTLISTQWLATYKRIEVVATLGSLSDTVTITRLSDGDPGADGDGNVHIYRHSLLKPATPTSGVANPTGWVKSPDKGVSTPIPTNWTLKDKWYQSEELTASGTTSISVISFTTTLPNQVVVLELWADGHASYDYIYAGNLNIGVTTSNYYDRVLGGKKVISYDVPNVGSHSIQIMWRKGISTIVGSNRGYFAIIKNVKVWRSTTAIINMIYQSWSSPEEYYPDSSTEETIYCLSKTETPPLISDSAAYIDEYLPLPCALTSYRGNFSTSRAYAIAEIVVYSGEYYKIIKAVPSNYTGNPTNTEYFENIKGWTDNAKGATKAFPFEYRSKRKKSGGAWGAFSASTVDGRWVEDGDGITSTTIEYSKSASGTTPPPSDWSTSLPSVTLGWYLWTRTTTTYKVADSTVAYTVSRWPEDGGTGKGVSSVVIWYYKSSSATTQTGGSWSTTKPDYSASFFLWTKVITTYTDNSATETTPILDPDWHKVMAITDKFGVTTEGALIQAVMMLLREANTLDVTAGISGIQGVLKNNPSLWSGGTYAQAFALIEFLSKMSAGTTPSSGEYSNLAKITLLHNGAAKVGDFIIEPSGRIVMVDPATGKARLVFGIENIPTIATLLAGTVYSGSAAVGGGATTSVQTLSGSTNVTKYGATATFNGTTISINASGKAQPSGISSFAVAELRAYRNGVRALTLATAMVYFTNTVNYQNELDTVIVPVTSSYLADAGLYTFKLEVITEGDITYAQAESTASTFAWAYTLQGVRRQQYGLDGMMFFYSDSHFHFTEDGGLDARAPVNKWNAPGVLFSGTVNSTGGFANSWGAKKHASLNAAKQSTGTYAVYHNVGHTNYQVSITPASNRTFYVTSKNTNYFMVYFYTNASTPALSDTAFDFMITGNNYSQ